MFKPLKLFQICIYGAVGIYLAVEKDSERAIEII